MMSRDGASAGSKVRLFQSLLVRGKKDAFTVYTSLTYSQKVTICLTCCYERFPPAINLTMNDSASKPSK